MKSLVIIMLLAIALNVNAQQHGCTIECTYDANGNRLECFVVNLKDMLSTMPKNDSIEGVLFDYMEYKDVKIYPNPTKGVLTVELPYCGRETLYSRFVLHTVSGDVVKQGDIYNPLLPVDITEKPNGVYILSLVGKNSKRVTIKIIKQ